MALPSEVEDLLRLDGKKNPSLQQYRPKEFNDRNLNCLKEGEENGIGTPHVLSMRYYAHIQAKHPKEDFFSQNMPFYPFRDLVQSQASRINQPITLTISTSNTYPNILKTMIY